MTFLAPMMLAGAAGVGIPLALHFFYRARYKPVPWAAMRFLKLSIEQTSRRLKFQERILLILRCLVCILIALAIARPASTGLSAGPSSGDSVDAIFLVDTSYSMGTQEGGQTRFDRARMAALKVLDRLPTASTVQIVGITDRPVVLGPKSPGNLDQARQIIRDLTPVSESSDLLPGFEEALAACDRGAVPNKEVYLFSDMQRLGWDRQTASLRDKAKLLRERAAIYMVRCGMAVPKNVAVIDVRAERGIPHTGTRTPFMVLIRNSGTEAVRDLTVTLEVDGRAFDKDSQSLPIIGAGETKAVTLTAKLDTAGWRTLSARVESDDLDADNRLDQMLSVRERTRVLVVDGAPNDRQPDRSSSYFLMHALRPVEEARWATYHIRPRSVKPNEASGALLTDVDVCILSNVALKPNDAGAARDSLPAEFVERLGTFVREGGALIIVSGPRVVGRSYNLLMGAETEIDLLPMPFGDVIKYGEEKPQHPAPDSIEVASFLGSFRDAPLNQIADVEVKELLAVDETKSKSGRVVMRSSDGKPLVLSRTVGSGEVIVLTTSLDTEWSDWPRRNTYVPFVQMSLAHLVQRSAAGYNRTAGSPLVWPQAESFRSYSLIRPDSEKVTIGKPQGGVGPDRLTLTYNDTARAGIYQFVSDDGQASAKFAVQPDLRESENLDSLSESQIDETLGFTPVHLTADGDLTKFSGDARSDHEWTIWVLLALFALTFGESIWAWVCGRAW